MMVGFNLTRSFSKTRLIWDTFNVLSSGSP